MNHKKNAILFVLAVICLTSQAQPWKEHGKLKVFPENPHYISYQDGKLFFWLADTGWEMIHRLNRKEIETYLDNRKEKGFNVIQTVLISEFIHMDKALINTKQQAYSYGWFLGNRYRNSPNIIWILGGDRHPDERENGPELWRAMAEGIADASNNINYAIDDNGVFTSTDVRLAAYWSVFSGAAGFTYGAQPIWQFTDETRKKVKASWFDPQNGDITVIGEFENKGERRFEVPGMSKELAWLKSGRGCDWVLVLEEIVDKTI